jgi:hypothetical protein
MPKKVIVDIQNFEFCNGYVSLKSVLGAGLMGVLVLLKESPKVIVVIQNS